jgi:1,3-beta-glucan synthase
LKQSKLRKRRVIRYAILYFFLLVIFVLLVAGPLIARSHIDMTSFAKKLSGNSLLSGLMQPLDNNGANNDTWTGNTGNNLPGGKTSQASIPVNELWTQSTGTSTAGAKMMFVL